MEQLREIFTPEQAADYLQPQINEKENNILYDIEGEHQQWQLD